MSRVLSVAAAAESVAEPEINLVAGVPEIFADMALLKSFGGMARVVLARQAEEFGAYEQVGLLLMPIEAARRLHAINGQVLAGKLRPRAH
jgi:hypothetical protein